MQIVHARDSQALHLVLQSRPLKSKPRRRAGRTRERAPRLTQYLDDMFAFLLAQGTVGLRYRLRVLLVQLGEGRVQASAFR